MTEDQPKRDETTLCSCVSCADCGGRGIVWFDVAGRWLGDRRCDDFDIMETCEECSGSGVVEVCSKCQDEWEDFNDDNQP